MVIRASKVDIRSDFYEYLKARILYGEIEPGERLAQEKVAEQLEISRMPVREAFRPNSYTGVRTPWGIVTEERPWISPVVLELPPVFLDEEFKRSQLPDLNHRVGTMYLSTPTHMRKIMQIIELEYPIL